MTPVRISFDVTDAVDLGEPCTIAGLLFLPDLQSRPTCAMLLLPGGSYTKNYYHLNVPGRADYSAAEFFAKRGFIALAIDHLGTGESTWPHDGRRVTLDVMATANARVAALLKERLASGTLDGGLRPIRNPMLIGHGHSLGGYLVQVEQAKFESYDAVVIAGSPCRPGNRGKPPVMMPADHDGYFLLPRAQNRGAFYFSDVPADVIACDDATFSALPGGMLEIGTPGYMIAKADKIDVPIFLAFGESDLSKAPHDEPAYYRNSNDVSLFILPRAGHCHNTASARVALWSRVADWGLAIVRRTQMDDLRH